MNRPIMIKSGATVSRITLSDLYGLWSTHRQHWQWQIPFVTPPWLSAWRQSHVDAGESFLLQATVDDRPIGMAPLLLQGGSVRFMGSSDLCDYGDFAVDREYQELFFETLLHYLKSEGVQRLALEPVRPESLVHQVLVTVARQCGWDITIKPVAASLQIDLPTSWDDYLNSLDAKQRHEVRRKMRRVADAGRLQQHVIRNATDLNRAMDIFFKLFRQSRPDKEEFMNDRRETFFRALAEELSRADMLNLHYFTVNGQPAAAVFCVDYNNTTYLYNNGFDPRFRSISLGLASKLKTIQAGIEAGQLTYDFLNGKERYKYQLGGKEIPLFSCLLEFG